jgi:hypothetical protein
MIMLDQDTLVFRFPKVHPEAECRIGFQRTLRIPDDGRAYPLPPGLGRFPLRHAEDYAAARPEAAKRGGVMLPMWQAEALWIAFGSGSHTVAYPCAVRVFTGLVDAVTGEPRAAGETLGASPQNYLVVPDQPWLDGYCVEKGFIRQFVAMPLGEGFSAEEQLTGAARHGGLQLEVIPMRRERYIAWAAEQRRRARSFTGFAPACAAPCADADMGLAPGGRMKQEIYTDRHGFEAWDIAQASRCFVTILNSAAWLGATGELPPTEPPSAQRYAAAGLPWFQYYRDDLGALAGAAKLAGLKSVAEKLAEQRKPLEDNESVVPGVTIPLGPKPRAVKEAEF